MIVLPDAIVLDVVLPDIDSFEVLRRLKSAAMCGVLGDDASPEPA
jgi:DNA-binding response OmpR family regulator